MGFSPALACAFLLSLFSSPFTLSSLFLFLPHFFPLPFLFSLPRSSSFVFPSPILCNKVGRKICPVDDILYFQYSSPGGGEFYRLRNNIVPTVGAFVSSLMGWPETHTPCPRSRSLAISSSLVDSIRGRKEINVKIRLLMLYL